MRRDAVTAGGLTVKIVGDPAVYARLVGRALEGVDLKAAETIAGAFAQQAQVVAEAQRVMAPGLAKFSAEVKQAEEVLGCSYDEIVDRVPNMPPEYGETTPRDVVEAGEMGYRGKAALDVAASWHRRTRAQPHPGSFARGHVALAAFLMLAARCGGHRTARHAVRLEEAPATTPTLNM